MKALPLNRQFARIEPDPKILPPPGAAGQSAGAYGLAARSGCKLLCLSLDKIGFA